MRSAITVTAGEYSATLDLASWWDVSAWVDVYERPPTEPGWYAVLLCFDAEEGILPNVAAWTGAAWRWNGMERAPDAWPLSTWHGPHATQAEALAWAYEHDPESLTTQRARSTP